MILKLMSFNTQHCKNYITKKIDYNEIINLINKYDVDIIGLNEIYGLSKNINQASKISKTLKYNTCFGISTHLLLLPYGNAIISKYPIISNEVIKIPYPKIKTGNKYYEKRSILKVILNINNNILTIYITHLGLNKDEQENGINLLLNSNKNKSIIMGDFNTDDSNMLKQLKKDFNDTTNEDMYSFPSKKPKRKYDYIFVSKDIKKISSYVLDEIISDHRPIYTEIDI